MSPETREAIKFFEEIRRVVGNSPDAIEAEVKRVAPAKYRKKDKKNHETFRSDFLKLLYSYTGDLRKVQDYEKKNGKHVPASKGLF